MRLFSKLRRHRSRVSVPVIALPAQAWQIHFITGTQELEVVVYAATAQLAIEAAYEQLDMLSLNLTMPMPLKPAGMLREYESYRYRSLGWEVQVVRWPSLDRQR